jgi:hypothetical protein
MEHRCNLPADSNISLSRVERNLTGRADSFGKVILKNRRSTRWNGGFFVVYFLLTARADGQRKGEE